MVDSAALLVDEILPHQPMRQWVLGNCSRHGSTSHIHVVVTVPFPLRFLFASQPAVMGKVLGIVYRAIATHLTRKAGFTKATARTGAVTLIQCFGGALNAHIHLTCMDALMSRAQGCARATHMLFLESVYADNKHGTSRFRRVKAPTNDELIQLTHTIAHRVGRYLERQGLLVRDSDQSYLTADAVDTDNETPMNHLLGSSITYRIAVGPQQGRKASASCSRPSPTSL